MGLMIDMGRSLFFEIIQILLGCLMAYGLYKTLIEKKAMVEAVNRESILPPGKIYGVGYKNGLHQMGLKESIVDLNLIRKPDFQVVDGVIGGEGYGPLRNNPVDSNIVLAGTDPVAIDTVGLTFMGFSLDEVAHVKLAAESGVGVADLSRIKVVGADLDEIRMDFARP